MSQATDPVRTGEPADDASVGNLVLRLSEQIPELVRGELRLAQAELAAKGKRAGVGFGLFGAAGVLAVYGLGVLIAAAVLALALVLPGWAAALVVAAVLLIVALGAALNGKKDVAAATPPAPERAIAGVREDLSTLTGGSHEHRAH